MIAILDAPPRSGKTFYMCNYLAKYVSFDALYQEYILKDDVLVISNIDGLKVRHWSLKYCLGISEEDSFENVTKENLTNFFSRENFQAIQKKTGKMHIILLIDEAHEIFPAGFYDQKIYNCFAMHGHDGIDILMATQGIEALSRMFNPLFEYIIRCTPRSKKVIKSFTYKFVDKKGKFLFPKSISSKQSVFQMYKSFDVDEFNKPRSAVAFWGVIVLGVFVAGAVMFKVSINMISNKGHKPPSVAQVKKDPMAAMRDSEIKEKSPGTDSVAATSAEPVDSWTTYYLEGFVRQGDLLYFLINGQAFQNSSRFRNFDDISKTVEYFGKPLKTAPEPAARPFERMASASAGLAPDLGGKAESLDGAGPKVFSVGIPAWSQTSVPH